MNGTTVARPTTRKDAHWYSQDGEPAHTQIGKSTGRPRPTTIIDARELGLLPSVTTILKVLHKEALVNWMIEQAVLACVTTPRQPGEADDAFIHRVLHVEEVQHEETEAAREAGTEVHEALEALLLQQKIEPDLEAWVMPAYQAVMQGAQIITTEQILVGNGYAGRTDAITKATHYTLWDFKSTKKLPDPKKGGAWMEHKLQLSAYAKAFCESAFAKDNGITPDQVQVANCYISRVESGQFAICYHDHWPTTFEQGFKPLITYWQWANRFNVDLDKPQISAAALIGRPASRQPAQAPAAAARPGGGRIVRDVGLRVLPPVTGDQPLPPMPIRTTRAAPEADANAEIEAMDK